MSLEGVQFEDFEPHVGEDFILPGDDQADPIPFKLIEASKSKLVPPKGFRQGFQLVFRVDSQTVFPQGMYLLTHPKVGDEHVFLVPMAQTEAGTDYCATYN